MAAKKAKSDQANPWLEGYPESVDWGMEINPGSLVDLVDDAVAEFGDKDAMDFLGKVWSFNDLGKASDQVAKGLQAQGIGPNTPCRSVAAELPLLSVPLFRYPENWRDRR